MSTRSKSSRSLVLTTLFALLAFPLAAQTLPHRQGFFIGFGLGGGGGEVSGNTNANGGTGWLTLGGTVNQKLRLAADFEGFSPNGSGSSNYGTSTFTALWYPSARGNFFLKGGVGAAEVSLSLPGPDGNGVGFGSVLGAGYDLRVGRKISITPQFTLFGGSTGDIKDSDGNVLANDVNFGVATLSVGIVFH
jgi:hypothetical protein